MDKHRTNALQYGHLGTAVYVPDSQTWEFGRRIEKGECLFCKDEQSTELTFLKDPPFHLLVVQILLYRRLGTKVWLPGSRTSAMIY
jgi:hypothetical protein